MYLGKLYTVLPWMCMKKIYPSTVPYLQSPALLMMIFRLGHPFGRIWDEPDEPLEERHPTPNTAHLKFGKANQTTTSWIAWILEVVRRGNGHLENIDVFAVYRG